MRTRWCQWWNVDWYCLYWNGQLSNKWFFTMFGLVMTLTFALLTSRSYLFIFVSSWTYDVNVDKFSQVVCKIPCSQKCRIMVALSRGERKRNVWQRSNSSRFIKTRHVTRIMNIHHHHARISLRRKSWTELQGRCMSRITLMSMLLWPIVCIAVWSAEQFRRSSVHAWMPPPTAATWSPAAAHSKPLLRQRGRRDRRWSYATTVEHAATVTMQNRRCLRDLMSATNILCTIY